MRTLFNRELEEIRGGIRTLGSQASSAIAKAVEALIARNLEDARAVKREDLTSDKLRYDIENLCLTVIATQQPVARDLRELTGATVVAVELERCGDYAKGIAKAARRIIRTQSSVASFNLRDMTGHALSMLDRSVEAFINQEQEIARSVIGLDDVVDAYYDDLLAQVTVDMGADPSHIEGGIWLLHAGHCLERIGDRATNIAERVIFLETGTFVGDLNVNRADGARALKG
jgi:phosphate transport system protein